jgi:hypothetical protein
MDPDISRLCIHWTPKISKRWKTLAYILASHHFSYTKCKVSFGTSIKNELRLLGSVFLEIISRFLSKHFFQWIHFHEFKYPPKSCMLKNCEHCSFNHIDYHYVIMKYYDVACITFTYAWLSYTSQGKNSLCKKVWH